MSLVRNILFACVAVAPLVFTPAAKADQWQKADGYWYFWSTNNQHWFYTDGKKWQVYDNGQWTDSGAPPAQAANAGGGSSGLDYSSYFYDPSPRSSSSGRSWSYSGGGRR